MMSTMDVWGMSMTNVLGDDHDCGIGDDDCEDGAEDDEEADARTSMHMHTDIHTCARTHTQRYAVTDINLNVVVNVMKPPATHTSTCRCRHETKHDQAIHNKKRGLYKAWHAGFRCTRRQHDPAAFSRKAPQLHQH